MRATVPTEAKAVVALVKGIGRPVHVAFEEGTQAQWLHDLLEPHADRVVVCNVRGRSETSNKSDRIDADWLSEQLRVNALKSVHHGSTGVATLKQLVRCYTNLVDDATRVMLRVKAIYRGRAVATSGKAVYRPSQRKAWLAKLENGGARERAASLLEQLDTLVVLRTKARAAMIAEARRQSGSKNRVVNCNRRDAVTLGTTQAARLPGRSRAASASRQSSPPSKSSKMKSEFRIGAEIASAERRSTN